MILDVLKHMGVNVPLGFVRASEVIAPKVCSGHLLRTEETCARGQGVLPVSLDACWFQVLQVCGGVVPPHLCFLTC